MTSLTTSTVTLAWFAATDNVGVTAYDIYQDETMVDSTAQSNMTVTGLTVGSTVTFTVRALDTAGKVSEPSHTLMIVTISDDPSTLPPEPIDIAPPNDETVVSDIYTDTRAADSDRHESRHHRACKGGCHTRASRRG